jgi:acyl-CoA dehydrogenase
MPTLEDSERSTELADRTRRFIDEEVIPVERELLSSQETISREQIRELQSVAREYEIYAPGYPAEYGGLGLDFRERVPIIEEAGRSLLGKVAVLVEVVDQLHSDVLRRYATDEQLDRWLPRIVDGEVLTAISMTEPMQGSGSDPTMLKTTAEKDGDEWVIDGHKTWNTRGSEADLLFVYARTDREAHPHDGLSCFLVPMETEGVNVVRDVPHMGGGVLGEVHSEIEYDDVRVPAENLLGDEGDGFRIFAIGLDRGRVWHGIHKAGVARRALDIAKAYMTEREAFGERISQKQAPRFEISKAETKHHVWRLFNREVAEKIANDDEPRVETAMHKYYCANVAQEVIDTAVQVMGSAGIGKDVPVSNFYETVRQYRIFDGPDEVHLRSIARDAFDGVDTSEVDPIPRYGDPEYREY